MFYEIDSIRFMSYHQPSLSRWAWLAILWLCLAGCGEGGPQSNPDRTQNSVSVTAGATPKAENEAQAELEVTASPAPTQAALLGPAAVWGLAADRPDFFRPREIDLGDPERIASLMVLLQSKDPLARLAAEAGLAKPLSLRDPFTYRRDRDALAGIARDYFASVRDAGYYFYRPHSHVVMPFDLDAGAFPLRQSGNVPDTDSRTIVFSHPYRDNVTVRENLAAVIRMEPRLSGVAVDDLGLAEQLEGIRRQVGLEARLAGPVLSVDPGSVSHNYRNIPAVVATLRPDRVELVRRLFRAAPFDEVGELMHALDLRDTAGSILEARARDAETWLAAFESRPRVFRYQHSGWPTAALLLERDGEGHRGIAVFEAPRNAQASTLAVRVAPPSVSGRALVISSEAGDDDPFIVRPRGAHDVYRYEFMAMLPSDPDASLYTHAVPIRSLGPPVVYSRNGALLDLVPSDDPNDAAKAARWFDFFGNARRLGALPLYQDPLLRDRPRPYRAVVVMAESGNRAYGSGPFDATRTRLLTAAEFAGLGKDGEVIVVEVTDAPTPEGPVPAAVGARDRESFAIRPPYTGMEFVNVKRLYPPPGVSVKLNDFQRP